MSEKEFREKALEYGYSKEEIDEIIELFHVENEIEFDEIPLFYQRY